MPTVREEFQAAGLDQFWRREDDVLPDDVVREQWRARVWKWTVYLDLYDLPESAMPLLALVESWGPPRRESL